MIILTEEQKAIFQKALDKLGPEIMIERAIEEMSEAILALQKIKRYPNDPYTQYNVLEEVTDAYGLLIQLITIFGEESSQQVFNYKLDGFNESLKD